MQSKQTSRREERELFLMFLSDVYLQNPSLPIKFDTIYNALLTFFIQDGEHYTLASDSLVGVQVGLNNKFRNNKKVNTFMSEDGYFWGIQNRMGKSDADYRNTLYDGFKVYISVQSDNIYKVAESLFNFMIDNNIVMECKIPMIMRNDALICRVSKEEDVLKISEYINSLDYECNTRPNPFLYNNTKISVTIDGRLLYNDTLSRIIGAYLNKKRESNIINKVSLKDFNNFIQEIIEYTTKDLSKQFLEYYKIDSKEKLRDFIIIINTISKISLDDITFDELLKIKDLNEKHTFHKAYSSFDENKILYVINRLDRCGEYRLDDIHKIIMLFIETGNYNLFPRKDNNDDKIRTIMYDFSSYDVKKIISIIGWKALLAASIDTYYKYGEEQLFGALETLYEKNKINLFTNDYGSRSKLSLVIPPELLKEVINNKLNISGKDINTNSFFELVKEEICNLEEKKEDGRK